MAGFDHATIDDVRTYWDRRPCNIRHSPAPVGTREYFDQVEARKYFVEPHIPGFAEFPRWAGKRVLEIGCGIGTDTMNFARAGAKVTAVDLSTASLELARQRAAVFGLDDSIEFFHGNAEVLSEFVPPAPYDLVYSFGVIHHTPNPERVFAELRHFTNPGTAVKVMLYNRRSWKVLASVLGYGKGRFWQLDEIVARHSEAQTGCPVTYTYTPAQAKRLLEDAGLKVTGVHIEHIFPYRVEDYVQYKYAKAAPWRFLPDKAFRALEHRLGWHLCISAEAR